MTQGDRTVMLLRPAILIIGALIGAACASPSGAPTDRAFARSIDIQMSDFAFSPARLLLRPGERVALHFTNAGSAEHEFMAGSGSMPGTGYMQDWLALAKLEPLEGDHPGGHMGTSVRLSAHGSLTLVILVPPQVGELEFGCFIADHYERGMHGTIVVDAGTAPNAVPAGSTGTRPSLPAAPQMTAMPHTSEDMGGMGDEGH